MNPAMQRLPPRVDRMSPSLRVRGLHRDDLPFADALREVVGWNQTPDDWRRFLALEPEGCFLAEWDGVPAGTATTLVYGSELAWIGMVLVHPDYRRRGISRALLGHGIARLHERGVRCIKLDATPLGKEVYDRLGFKDEWTLTRWEHAGLPLAPAADGRVRPWRPSDAALVAGLDVAAFGISRHRLLEVLAPQGCAARVLETAPDHIAGYGLLRPGARALYLGPVVADSPDAGLLIVQALLACSRGERIFWDIPDRNAAAVAWARAHGFAPQRGLTRMVFGENPAPGDPRQQFALAGPEVG